MRLFEFKGDRERWRGSRPSVCVGPIADICALIDRDELQTMFGGYAIYVSDDDASEYIGVWGTRKASQFRQTLEQRGANLEVVQARPLHARLKSTSVRYTSSAL